MVFQCGYQPVVFCSAYLMQSVEPFSVTNSYVEVGEITSCVEVVYCLGSSFCVLGYLPGEIAVNDTTVLSRSLSGCLWNGLVVKERDVNLVHMYKSLHYRNAVE